jgi:biotin carboxyl carrier protein
MLIPVDPAHAALRARRNTAIIVVPILLVLITFLFWYETWFGRPLTDQEMTSYLADTSVPHKTQHALSQLAERLARGDVTARRWYPELLALARHKEPQLRLLAAWAMGQDNHSEDFHQALRGLVADPAPLVRWNAALALVRFGDSAGEPQLRAMLQPYTVVAPMAGALTFRLKEGDLVRSGSVVARIRPQQVSGPVDVVSPLIGEVARRVATDGAAVAAGEALAVISPGETQVWESLRALCLVGQPQDLEDVDRYARGMPHMSERVRQQAETTAQAIRQRAAP